MKVGCWKTIDAYRPVTRAEEKLNLRHKERAARDVVVGVQGISNLPDPRRG